jgi:hypothetical protein
VKLTTSISCRGQECVYLYSIPQYSFMVWCSVKKFAGTTLHCFIVVTHTPFVLFCVYVCAVCVGIDSKRIVSAKGSVRRDLKIFMEMKGSRRCLLGCTAPYSDVVGYRRFGLPCCLHLQFEDLHDLSSVNNTFT